MDCKMSQELKDLYEICMNKNYLTRPTARELLNLDMIQQWAKDLNVMNHQLSKYGRDRSVNKRSLDVFLKASKVALEETVNRGQNRRKMVPDGQYEH